MLVFSRREGEAIGVLPASVQNIEGGTAVANAVSRTWVLGGLSRWGRTRAVSWCRNADGRASETAGMQRAAVDPWYADRVS